MVFVVVIIVSVFSSSSALSVCFDNAVSNVGMNISMCVCMRLCALCIVWILSYRNRTLWASAYGGFHICSSNCKKKRERAEEIFLLISFQYSLRYDCARVVNLMMVATVMGECCYWKTAYVRCAKCTYYAYMQLQNLVNPLHIHRTYKYVVHTHKHCMVPWYFFFFLFSFLFNWVFFSYHLLLFVPHITRRLREKRENGEGESKGRIHQSNVNCDTKKACNVCSAIFSKAFGLAVCNSFLYFIFECVQQRFFSHKK